MAMEIRTTPALVGVDRTPSKLNIETQNARLEFQPKQPRVNIRTEPVKVLIDQYDSFAERGLKNNYDLIKEAADRGKQQALEFVGKTAEDGDRLAAIEKGGNPIAEIVKRDAYPVHEFGYVTIPKTGPKFTVTGGTVQLDPERTAEGADNGIDGTYIPGKVEINYTPDVVRIYMRQYPSISIQYLGNNIDEYR